MPETVKKCLEIEPNFKSALEEWLGYQLRKLTGEAIPLNTWSFEGLTEHLKMNFRIVNDDGRLLDYGRDLKALQAKHVTKAGESFDQIAADELNFTGYIQWAFDDLPEQYSFMQKGQAFIGYPALVDEGETVGVKIFDTQRKAELQHQAAFAQFKHLPRYLKAMQYRLDKRDNTSQKANELARFQIRYWNSVSQRLKKEIVTPETETFRWMLEEFAVSLFAQQLKTAIPVSAQRLEKAWESGF